MLDCQATPTNNSNNNNNHHSPARGNNQSCGSVGSSNGSSASVDSANVSGGGSGGGGGAGGASRGGKKRSIDAIQCQYCKESDQLGGSDPTVYWGIQLDQDLIETLTAIYPEWFKDYNNLKGGGKSGVINLSPKAMADGSDVPGVFGSSKSNSKTDVDETPIHKTMDKHKESLKVKLLLRRPITQLVDQGIMPPLKTPPGFHEQRQKLERAKMGDILKSKIQRRPDRQELIQQHILEDSNVDPSLQDKQRQLKKARLADDLNERLAHRPGPLELIKGNILKADELFAQAIKDGQIPFKRTCEGESRKHPPPPFLFEEDSSSEGALSPLQEMDQTQTVCVNSSPPDINIPVPSPSLGSAVSSLSPLSSVASPASVSMSPANLCAFISTSAAANSLLAASPAVSVLSPVSKLVSASNSSAPSPLSSTSCTGRSISENGKEQTRSRKKSKSKSTPKTRTIKFHEYKGPPNAQKNYQSNSPEGETSYELLLQQQQLFLQWQLELQHKYPQIILPAAQKIGSSDSGSLSTNIAGNVQGTAPNAMLPEIQSSRCLTKLEDMKVSDLKLELKKRNLTVSGSKPQLIERLRPYSDMATVVISANNSILSNNNMISNGESSSCPSSVANLDSSSQGSPAEDHSLLKNQDDRLSGSPSSEHMLDHDSLEASLTETVNGDLGYTLTASPYSMNGMAHTPLHRPPSVAPMDVEGGSAANSEFDHMDISDIARNLPPMSSSNQQSPMSSSIPTTTTSLPILNLLEQNNAFVSQAYNEDALRKKIEELQRELQRSQMQLHQQQQSMMQRQQNIQNSPRQSPSPSPNTSTQTQPTVSAVIPNASISELKNPPNNSLVGSDQKLQQQKLILQQHIQQKLHQQQLQQQNVNTNPTPGTVNVKASLAAFLQGQASVANSSNPPKIYFRVESNASLPEPTSGLCDISTDDAAEDDSLTNSNKQRANSLPNGLGHIRTNSLPNFAGLSTIPQKQPISRTTTDPQFLFNKPPPDYDEATKQLKQQFAHTLIETLNRPVRGHKSVKSQDVEDVLEILIKNGELPPSAAQEPPTPPTPKGMQGPLIFATNNAPSNISTNNLQIPTTTVAHQLQRNDGDASSNMQQQQQTQNSHDNVVVMDVGLSSTSPNPSTPPTFDLDLNLDLDALEPMNLEGFSMDSHMKGDPSDYLGTNHDVNSSTDFSMFSDDAMHIDIDMTDVSDWLDEILPNPVSSNNNMGNDSLSSHLNVLLPSTNSNIAHHIDCNDPLLSANQDIFNLLNLEDDFKTTSDLSVLAWDKVDFAT